MARVARNVTAKLTIESMCRHLHMTEEQLLVHLAVEYATRELAQKEITQIIERANRYHRQGVFVLEVDV